MHWYNRRKISSGKKTTLSGKKTTFWWKIKDFFEKSSSVLRLIKKKLPVGSTLFSNENSCSTIISCIWRNHIKIGSFLWKQKRQQRLHTKSEKFPISLSTKFFMRFRELLKWIHQRNQIDQRIHTHTHTQINFAGASVTKGSKPKNLVNLNLAFVSKDQSCTGRIKRCCWVI